MLKENRKSQNSLKTETSFYEQVLDEAEKLDFETASGTEGLDDEITLLRVKIKNLLEKDPDNLKLVLQATDSLAKLVQTRYRITHKQKKGLKEAIGNVIRDIALPVGIEVLKKKL